MRTFLAMAVFLLLLAHAGSARTPTNPEQRMTGNYESAQSEAQKSQAIRDELHKKLKEAGFTEIEMIPSQMLVRAKDQRGNPVTLVIDLDGAQKGRVGNGSDDQ